MVEALLFFCACILLLTLSIFTRRRCGCNDALTLAIAFFVDWAWSKPLIFGLGWDAARSLYPMADLLVLVLALWLWYQRHTRWKLAIIGVTIVQLVAHYDFNVILGAQRQFGHDYQTVLNGCFGLNLILAAIPGGQVLGRILVDHLSERWAGGLHPGLARAEAKAALRK